MSQENATEVNHLQELVNSFTLDQLQYLAVRPFVRWDKDAARAIGLAPETVSRWENKADVDEAIRLMAADGVIVAGSIFRKHLPKAALAIVNELEHRSADIRLKAASEVLDRGGLGKTQRTEIDAKVDSTVVVSYVNDWRSPDAEG